MAENLTYRTSQADGTLQFDAAHEFDFDGISALGAGVVLATVQGTLPAPYAYRLYSVAVSYTGALSGSVQLQLVTGAGSGAGATVGTPGAIAPTNTIVFSTPPTIAAGLAGITQVFYPSVQDVIYGNSNSFLGVQAPAMTLRFITGVGAGITGITKVILGIKSVNIHETASYAPTPAGNYGFDSSVI